METYIAIIVLVGVIVFQAVVYWLDRKDWREQRLDLMNRHMSRTFGEYASGVHRLKMQPDEPVSGKERLNREAMEMERAGDILAVT